MEIGPVSGIRAISPVGVQKPEGSMLPVFVIDPSARTDDETYSSSSQESGRGLEGEESSSRDGEPGADSDDLQPQTSAGVGINVFA